MRILGISIAAAAFTIVSATLVAAQTPVTAVTPPGPLHQGPGSQPKAGPAATTAPAEAPGVTVRIATKPLAANFFH